MKKYLFIFKSEVMTSLQYVFDIVSRFVSYLLIVFIFVNLWNYIYSDPAEIINGYTMSQMMWYLIITELIWFTVGSRSLTKIVSEDIKTGSIVYKLNKPYDYINYIISSHLGSIVLKLIMFAIFGASVGFIFIGSFPPLSIPMILIFILSTILALLVNIVFSIIIALFSFYVEDSSPLHWVYSKFILVLGTFFPVEYFPAVIAEILKFSPIVAVSYGPARLFVSFSYDLAWKVLLAQVIYLAIAYLIARLIYKKGVKKLNVNGG